jgi:hypothetical protein
MAVMVATGGRDSQHIVQQNANKSSSEIYQKYDPMRTFPYICYSRSQPFGYYEQQLAIIQYHDQGII